MAKTAPDFDKIIRQMIDLSDDQLAEITCAIQAIKTARSNCEITTTLEPAHAELADPGRSRKSPNGSGCIEQKTINGHEYYYFRHWSGKTHKSVYLGKQRPGV